MRLKTGVSSDKIAAAAAHESKIMQGLDHPHILKVLGSGNMVPFPSADDEQKIVSYLAVELAAEGDLYDKIVERKLSEQRTLEIFVQLLKAVKHCHDRGICHRDLKPENILLGESQQVKLADFGVSGTFKENVALSQRCGTPAYMAPEILAGKQYLGNAADVFSLGAILFNMVTSFYPFKSAVLRDPGYVHLFAGDHASFWNFHKKSTTKLCPEMKTLIQEMLQPDLLKRPSVGEVLLAVQKMTHFIQKEEGSPSANESSLTLETTASPEHILNVVKEFCAQYATKKRLICRNEALQKAMIRVQGDDGEVAEFALVVMYFNRSTSVSAFMRSGKHVHYVNCVKALF